MNKEYMLIGLTGPTGAGKSMVSSYFEKQGFGVVDADKIAHKALLDDECIRALTESFTEDILNDDGSINRAKTARAAFSTSENTKKLNSITHPVILRLAKAEFERLSGEGFNRIIFDAPTLFESGADKMCQKIIVVTASLKVRLTRLIARDSHRTKEEILSRINAQKPDEYYKERADFVIENSGDTEGLENQIKTIIRELLNEQ